MSCQAANGNGGNTALCFAAQGPWPNGIDVVRLLIDAGADINRQCEHGRTALHMAAAWGHADLVQLLLDRGADSTLVDEEGMTAPEVARNGYSSNNVTAEQRQAVCELLASRGIE